MSSDQNFKLFHQEKQKDNTVSGLEKPRTDFPVHLRESGCPSVSLASPSIKQTVWSHQCLKHFQLPSQQDLSFMQGLTLPAWFLLFSPKLWKEGFWPTVMASSQSSKNTCVFSRIPLDLCPRWLTRGDSKGLFILSPVSQTAGQGTWCCHRLGDRKIFMTLVRGGWERLEFGQCVLKNLG